MDTGAINAACRLKLVLVNPPERFTYDSYNTLQRRLGWAEERHDHDEACSRWGRTTSSGGSALLGSGKMLLEIMDRPKLKHYVK